jgi:predicted transcriptional regulator
MSKIKNLKQILTREFLVEKYAHDKLSVYQIGKMVGCSGVNVHNYLKKYYEDKLE